MSILSRVADIVGSAHLLTGPADTAAYTTDWRQRFHGSPLAVALPATTEQVAALVRLSRETGTPLVPQGGNTGTVGGATPDASGNSLVVALRRMHTIRRIDRDNATLTAEAGCTLAEVQAAAAAHDLLYPLSLASEGSCQIGGNLAANAGGMAVLRYGNTRELTLGIEAVLPDGQIINALKGLRKNNSGFDAKQLFIGTEGLFGIITAATLKLYPQPSARATALVGVASPTAAVTFLHELHDRFGDRLTTYELVSGLCLALVARHVPAARPPFETPWSVLFELSDGSSQDELDTQLFDWLDGREAFTDAVLARSERERRELWRLREDISDAQRRDGPSIKHDIAVPVSAIPAFLEQCGQQLEAAYPGCRIVAFGHLGDGNLHYNISHTRPGNHDLFADEQGVNDIVFSCAYALDGTLSAEHGIGQLRRQWLARFHDPASMALMRTLKTALDPANLMNPGKLLP